MPFTPKAEHRQQNDTAEARRNMARGTQASSSLTVLACGIIHDTTWYLVHDRNYGYTQRYGTTVVVKNDGSRYYSEDSKRKNSTA